MMPPLVCTSDGRMAAELVGLGARGRRQRVDLQIRRPIARRLLAGAARDGDHRASATPTRTAIRPIPARTWRPLFTTWIRIRMHAHGWPRMMRGVMKISSSWLSLRVSVRLNSQPSSGMLLTPGVLSSVDVSLRLQDAADDGRHAVGHLHLRFGALRVDRRVAVDRAAEVRQAVLEDDAHDDGVGAGDLRRHQQLQRRVLELHRDRVVRRRSESESGSPA